MNNDTSAQEAEERTVRSILDQDRTAAAIICQLKLRSELASKMPLMKDILGFVATLGKVNNDNLSRYNISFLVRYESFSALIDAKLIEVTCLFS